MRARVRLLSVFLLSVLLQSSVSPQSFAERRSIELARDADFAVLAIMFGMDSEHPGDSMYVVGTAFVVSADGYFVTAAHVLEQDKANSPQLTAVVRQRDGNGVGALFDVIDKDDAHDLALCRLKGRTQKIYLGSSEVRELPKSAETPYASLKISDKPPVLGQFIVVAGFPLGSMNPAFQFGTLAATQTVNPNMGRVPAGQRSLLQISAAVNKGNSGSPVLALTTGEVVGVIVQAIPAPLYSKEPLPAAQSSGMALAVPAIWIQELLKKHGIVSAAIVPKTLK
jgi:S1-C subfamily serine protease